MGLKGMEKSDPYEVIEINPQISLDFEFSFGQVDGEYSYYDYNSPAYKTRSTSVNNFKNLLNSDDVISRYFRAIGYPNIKFTLNENWSVTTNHVSFEIKIESF